MNRFVVALFILLTISAFVFAEESPQEYEDSEFSDFQRDIRRGEIIFFGSLPFTMFVCLESFDIYRFVANDQAPEYRPWPFQTQSVPYTQQQSVGVLISALSLSFILALSDFIIGKIREKNSAPDT
jgi:hypothetical protein